MGMAGDELKIKDVEENKKMGLQPEESKIDRRIALLEDVGDHYIYIQGHYDCSLALQVEELKKKLIDEVNVGRVLERALCLSNTPSSPCSSRIPMKLKILLQEVVELEEDVIGLEEQVLSYRGEIYKEATFLHSSKQTTEWDWESESESDFNLDKTTTTLADLLSDSEENHVENCNKIEMGIDENGNPNRIAENMLRCLIAIFTTTGGDVNSTTTEDPYGICLAVEGRDHIDLYNNNDKRKFISIQSHNINSKSTTPPSLLHNLK